MLPAGDTVVRLVGEAGDVRQDDVTVGLIAVAIVSAACGNLLSDAVKLAVKSLSGACYRGRHRESR